RRSAVDYIAALEPEALYHLAACAREGASWFQPAHVTQTNMAAYVNTLTGCLKYKGFKRVVLFSSMAVYGDQQPPFDEDAPTKPVDPYGLNKAAMEEMTKMLCKCHGISYVIIRPNNVFGPGQSLRDKYRNVLAIWCNCIMRGEEAWIFGDGEQTRAFSYIGEALPAYLRCLERGDNRTFNIGGLLPITINEAWRLMSAAMGAPNHPVRHVPARYGEVKAAFCSQSRAVEELCHWAIGFERGILEMAKYARRMGPQEWVTDTLELRNERLPEEWHEKPDTK
ncbi:MAG: NAD-dependent epimerase/dehydratase family protein, partial [Nitrospinae bacterium]|nr:NAD-dependent epimerase/dehydratase family protein [Nitrospinota bacterium]